MALYLAGLVLGFAVGFALAFKLLVGGDGGVRLPW